MGSFAEHFWNRVDKTDGPVLARVGTPCWQWKGGRHHFGYGVLLDPEVGKVRVAHRISWRLTIGTIPDGMWVLHRCDNPSCVNPTHLFLGTNSDNMKDAVAKGRQKLRGFRVRRGSDNGRARISEADVLTIRDERSRGIPVEVLAEQFGLTCHHIYRIANGERWKHV